VVISSKATSGQMAFRLRSTRQNSELSRWSTMTLGVQQHRHERLIAGILLPQTGTLR
jgi:hypothetical protein